jgi:hypothetical protein
MNEVKKTLQDMKEKINKNTGTVKNNQSELNNSILKQKSPLKAWQSTAS